jgi:acetyltransferase-like isoleucine patch superfamily enzyme
MTIQKKILNIFREGITEGLFVSFRYYYWKLFILKLGKKVKFYGKITVLRPYNLSIGDFSSINESVYLNARTSLFIGNNVHISVGTIITTTGLDYMMNRDHISKTIIIKDNVWIGSNAIILPGVIIGENSVVGAGAVVTKSIPPNSVAVGVPARVIKSF